LEYVYLVVALVWGIALVAVMPPFQVPDEPAHFDRAWGLAQGAFLPPRDFKEDLPADVWSLQGDFPVGPINAPGHYPAHVGPGLWTLFKQHISPNRVANVTSVPSQNPVAYVPQAVGVEIARVTDSSPLAGFYLARLVNLLVAVALVFFAVRLAPVGKAMILIVALFPGVISEMASVSPDALMIAGAMFFTGLALNYSERAKLETRSLVALLVAGCVLLTVKPGYFPIVALVCMLSPRCFVSRRRYAAWLAGIMGSVLAISALLVLATPKAPAGVVVGPAPPGTNVVLQLEHVARDPLGFAAVILHSFAGGTLEYGRELVGVLGWLTINVSQSALLLLLAVVMVLGSGLTWEPPLGARRRAVLLTTWLVTAACMLLALYAALTPIGGLWVYGVQGRYWAPFLPLLLIGLSGFRFRRRSIVVILLLVVFALVSFTTMRAVWFHYH
jgi:uncharacterized membrane protein